MSSALPRVRWSCRRAGQAQGSVSWFPALRSSPRTFDTFVVASFPIEWTVLENIFSKRNSVHCLHVIESNQLLRGLVSKALGMVGVGTPEWCPQAGRKFGTGSQVFVLMKYDYFFLS